MELVEEGKRQGLLPPKFPFGTQRRQQTAPSSARTSTRDLLSPNVHTYLQDIATGLARH